MKQRERGVIQREREKWRDRGIDRGEMHKSERKRRTHEREVGHKRETQHRGGTHKRER